MNEDFKISQVLMPRKTDIIPWKVMNCELEECPLSLCLKEEIDAMTREKTRVSRKTVCPTCLRSVTWKVRDLINRDGEEVHVYCHGTLIKYALPPSST